MLQRLNGLTVAAMAIVLSGCVTLTSSAVKVQNLTNEPKGERVVTFLNSTPYMADMSEALAEYGFTVKPMPTQQFITERQSPSRVAQYNQATTQWGISVMATPTDQKCVFTDYAIYNFTIMLVDIRTDTTAMVIKQRGSDGPCTTVKPVFPTLAKALSENW